MIHRNGQDFCVGGSKPFIIPLPEGKLLDSARGESERKERNQQVFFTSEIGQFHFVSAFCPG